MSATWARHSRPSSSACSPSTSSCAVPRKNRARTAFSVLNRGLYRMSGGRIGGKMKGAPILLLTTTGRKSGKARTMPLLYVEDGDRFAVIASAGGQQEQPAWYLNLRENPEVEVEVGRERRKLRARVAEGEERERY